MINMKCQVLFFSEKLWKSSSILECHLLQILLYILRLKNQQSEMIYIYAECAFYFQPWSILLHYYLFLCKNIKKTPNEYLTAN